MAGHSLRLADADGHVCAAQPKGALDVASVDGAVITLATPLTAGGSSADCVLVREVDPCAQVALLPSVSQDMRQRCPVRLTCDDSETIMLPNVYTCICPSCEDVLISSTTSSTMQSYLQANPPVTRYTAGALAAAREGIPQGTCKDTSRTGCMDPEALNFDPAAFVSDPDACIAKVWGCPADATAANTVAASNSYDHANAEHQCRGVYCSTDGTMAGITDTRPTWLAAPPSWSCAAGTVVEFGGQSAAEHVLLEPFDECSLSPCNSPSNLAQALASGKPLQTCEQLEIGDLPRAWVCDDPNFYWLGDYSCSCAHDAESGEYESAVLETCGAVSNQIRSSHCVFFADRDPCLQDPLVEDSRRGTFSRYEVTSWLVTDAQRRHHLCKVGTGDPDCVPEAARPLANGE